MNPNRIGAMAMQDALRVVLAENMPPELAACRREMERLRAEMREKQRVALKYPMLAECWYDRGRKCYTEHDAITEIHNSATEMALVMLGQWDCTTSRAFRSSESEFFNLVAPLRKCAKAGEHVEWQPERTNSSAYIKVSCSTIRRFLLESNVWWYLPSSREFHDVELTITHKDEVLSDFTVCIHVCRRTRFDEGSLCPQCLMDPDYNV